MPDPSDDQTLPAMVRRDVSADVAVKPAVVPADELPTEASRRMPGKGVTVSLPALIIGAAVLFALGLLVARLF